jgi:hypothetical protein
MNNSTTYTWQGPYQCAVLETDSTQIAARIDDALRAMEHRVGTTVRMDRTESDAIESARNGLAVIRGEWFGGLAESMKGPAPDRLVVILNLFGTVKGETAWLGTFGDIDSAKAKLKEILAVSPGYYLIYDQTTGEKIFSDGV